MTHPRTSPPMHTHAQHDTRPARGPRQRALADLCRQQPAVWSWIVRYSDQLERHGTDPDDAVDQAAALVGLTLPPAHRDNTGRSTAGETGDGKGEGTGDKAGTVLTGPRH